MKSPLTHILPILLGMVSPIALFSQSLLPDTIPFSSLRHTLLDEGRVIFSDTSYRNGKIFSMWNYCDGTPTAIHNYYHMQGGLLVEPQSEMQYPAVCSTDTNFLVVVSSVVNCMIDSIPLSSLSGRHDYKNPFFGLSLHYDVCAPSRSKSIAGTTKSYRETYPDWTDNSGGAFGFLTRTHGKDSMFADGNKRRVYYPSQGGNQAIILTHPFPNDEFVGEHKITHNTIHQRIFDQIYGRELYISIHLRRLDSLIAPANDTLLVLRVPYTTKPGMGPLQSTTRNIVFDSVPHGDLPSVSIIGSMPPFDRGQTIPLMHSQTTKLAITRSMLPPNQDITITAHFRLKGDESLPRNFILDGSENHRLWSPNLPANDTTTSVNGTIKRLEPEVTYYNKSTIAIDWIRLETPMSQRLFRGEFDSILQQSLIHTLDSMERGRFVADNAWEQGAYQGKIRWHRIWLPEEEPPRSFHALGYVNHILQGRGMTETGYTTQWLTREFDENGNGIDGVDPQNIYRAAQLRYYSEHFAREANTKENWRGDTYSLIAHNAVPYSWYSQGGIQEKNLGIFNGYFSPDKKEQYTFGNVPFEIMQQEIFYRYLPQYHPSSLITIEGYIAKYATEPYMLFDTKHSWLASMWWSPRIQMFNYSYQDYKTCTPGINCPRTARIDGVRMNSGEELRFSLWLQCILGMKGYSVWTSRSKILSDMWDEISNLPDSSGFEFNERKMGFISPHQFTVSHGFLPKSPHNISWHHSDVLGSDYVQNNDPMRIDMFAQPFDTIAKYQGVQKERIYVGRKTMRHELKKFQQSMEKIDTTVMRLQLENWFAKGYKSYLLHRDSSAQVLFEKILPVNTITTQKIVFNTENRSVDYEKPESRDSSFYDITLLRDIHDTTALYIGILNRRLDPVFTIAPQEQITFGTTLYDPEISTKYKYCSLPPPEFDSLIASGSTTLSSFHPFCQKGSRRITIPLNFSDVDKKIRIEELGFEKSSTIDHRDTIAVNMLPGEGKIMKITFLSASSVKPIEEQNEIRIIPNPANDKFTVSYPMNNGILTVCDMTGRIILSEKFNESHTISTETLPIGVYIVKVSKHNTTVYGKVIVHAR